MNLRNWKAFRIIDRTVAGVADPGQASTRPATGGLRRWLFASLVLLVFANPVHAHVEAGHSGGFAAGFAHPWSGWDHIIAMVAVGLWGAQLGAPAVWLLPVAFPMVMAVGGFLGLIGVQVPGVEIGIALSAVVLGGAVWKELRPPLGIAAALVGVFGLFHGHAHGAELPAGGDPLLYSIGFVVATGTLHAAGIGIGLVHRWPTGRTLLRGAGAVIAVTGSVFLWQAIR